MKVLSVAILALAVLAASANAAAAVVEERNLRGSMEMYHLKAHKAHHPAAMESRGSNDKHKLKGKKHSPAKQSNMEAKVHHHATAALKSRGKPKQKGRTITKAADKKSSMEAKPTPSGDKPPPYLPMKGGKVDIDATIAAAKKRAPATKPGPEPKPPAPPVSKPQPAPMIDIKAVMDKMNNKLPLPVAKPAANSAMEAKDKEAQVAIADAMESKKLVSEGAAFEAQLPNQKTAKGKKDRKDKKDKKGKNL